MKTNYPIVLVHGLGIKDMLWLKAFGKIDRILRMQGYTVFTSKIDAFGTIEGNAAQLRDEILQILEAEHTEKVNLIAHSKGGLDAEYMLSNEGMAHYVASLTTLCTPHRGSPIASFILRFPSALVKYAAFGSICCIEYSAIKRLTHTPPVSSSNASHMSNMKRFVGLREYSVRAFPQP